MIRFTGCTSRSGGFLFNYLVSGLIVISGLIVPSGLTVASGLIFCLMSGLAGPTGAEGADMELKVTSKAFSEGGTIPKKYTCDGPDVSPAISWDNVPNGTKSLALICDDADSPGGRWVHWVVFGIPPSSKELQENVPPQKVLPGGIKQGMNDFRKPGYGGPCPPAGVHRYYFKVYAIDTGLKLDAGATKDELLKAMEGHILAGGQLMGQYKR